MINKIGISPLHNGNYIEGNTKILEFLLLTKADVNEMNKYNQTALNLATYFRNLKNVKTAAVWS